MNKLRVALLVVVLGVCVTKLTFAEVRNGYLGQHTLASLTLMRSGEPAAAYKV
jgi:hypothetical protein